MDMDMLYLDSLQIALNELGTVESRLSEFTEKKDDLRLQIRRWMEINNTQEFETTDISNIDWSLSILQSSRRSVNYDLLEKFLTADQYNLVVNTTPVETFRCQQRKSVRSKTSRKKAPKSTY